VSQSHLSHVFQKMVGEPPGRWRRSQMMRKLVIAARVQSELNNPAFQANHGGMSAVFGAQFGQNVPYLSFDGLLAQG